MVKNSDSKMSDDENIQGTHETGTDNKVNLRKGRKKMVTYGKFTKGFCSARSVHMSWPTWRQ